MPITGGTEVERLIVRLVGDGKSLEQAAQQAVRTMEKADKSISQSVDRIARRTTDLGKKLTTRLTLPITALGVASIKFGSDFDTGFAGVRKTVDATEQELAVMREQFKEMAREVPQPVEELLRLGETAGQLGIANKNIMGFVRTMADLNVATNLGEEGPQQLARFANIAGLAQDEFDRLGSSIVALGNSTATTEQDIVSMALRLGAAGKTVGASVPQITGMAAALSSVGLESEAGGTAFSKLMVNLSAAVATGSDELDTFAQITGQTVDQFSKAFREDAVGAIGQFLRGLDQMDPESRIVALQELGIEEVRLRDAILRASGAVDLFDDALQTSQKAFEDNTALSDEASKRYESFASKVQLLKNDLKALLTEAFEVMEPVLRDIIKRLQGMFEFFRQLSPETKRWIVIITALVAALGPLLTTLGLVTIAVKGLMTALLALSATPVGLALAAVTVAVAAIGAAFVSAGIEAAAFEAKIRDMTAKIKQNVQQVRDTTEDLVNQVQNLGGEAGKQFVEQQIREAERRIRDFNKLAEEAQRERKKLVDRVGTVETQEGGAKFKVRFEDVEDQVREQVQAYENATKQAGAYEDRIKELRGALNGAGEAAEKAGEGVKKFAKESEESGDSYKKLLADIQSRTTEVIEPDQFQRRLDELAIGGLDPSDQKTLENALQALRSTETEAAFDEFVKGLEFTQRTLGKTAEEVELLKLAEQGLSDEQMEIAQDRINSLKEARKEMEEAEKQAKKDYTVDFGVKGVDAVAAGSAEAIARMREFLANRPRQTVTIPQQETSPLFPSPDNGDFFNSAAAGGRFFQTQERQRQAEEFPKDFANALKGMLRELQEINDKTPEGGNAIPVADAGGL